MVDSKCVCTKAFKFAYEYFERKMTDKANRESVRQSVKIYWKGQVPSLFFSSSSILASSK